MSATISVSIFNCFNSPFVYYQFYRFPSHSRDLYLTRDAYFQDLSPYLQDSSMTVASQEYCPHLDLTVTQCLTCFKIISLIFDFLTPTLNYARSASTSHYLHNLAHICNMPAHERTLGGVSWSLANSHFGCTDIGDEFIPREKCAHHSPILEGSISFSGTTSFTHLEGYQRLMIEPSAVSPSCMQGHFESRLHTLHLRYCDQFYSGHDLKAT